MKYKRLAELKYVCDRARAGGKEAPVLWLDNDTTGMYVEGEKVFEMHPGEVLEQALTLLGIPHEGV